MRMAGVPRSTQVASDPRVWGCDWLRDHYCEVRPLCELVLTGQNPCALAGDWRSPSMMFPMERLLARYVGACLARRFAPDWRVSGAALEYLCRHGEVSWSNLIPDILLRRGNGLRVLDTKWKVLEAAAGDACEKYGLKKSDYYQMFAYGRRYLSGAGQMALVYP